MTELDILKIIGANIREVRKVQEISQDLFALIAGIDRSYLASVERGERNISAKNIVKIARAFGVIPGDLLKGIS
jgi:transcriptional regulator with XRE-family HTH domain